ncbi:DUF4407 domain-containing protein [Paenibacillus sp. MER 99-2]|uniref:DUF4407 domain-containing protein n=1 Tax=Paenibacillus sp. MER 99-2 TaxID=2939572 RepID=UPI00203E63C7|nr:DUF4407 domain-containing protein [Paenibacillus sp. MER 99-2]MCM3175431.1 DUF4407 domain-containing protein [Paenibacillus sp. MER 99-2]
MKNFLENLKEKITRKIKKFSNKAIESFIGLHERMYAKSSTVIGTNIKQFRKESYVKQNDVFVFEHEVYLNKIRQFYFENAEDLIRNMNLNYLEQLLLRRKEIKNQSNYLANVGIAVATGILTGLFVNNISKFGLLISSVNDNLFVALFRGTLVFSISLLISFLPIVLLIVFKKFISIQDPLIQYTEEVEIEVIELIIRDKLKLQDISKKA